MLIADKKDLTISKNIHQNDNVFSMMSRKFTSAGFEITDKVQLSKVEIVEELIRKYLLQNPQGVELKVFEKVMRGSLKVELIGKVLKKIKIKWDLLFPELSHGNLNGARLNSKKILMKIYEFAEEILKPVDTSYQFHAFCINCPKVLNKYESLSLIQEQLTPFLEKYQQKIFYFSKDNKTAFLDKQIFFEEEYLINKSVKIFLPSSFEGAGSSIESGLFQDICQLNDLMIIKKTSDISQKMHRILQKKMQNLDSQTHQIFEVLTSNPNAQIALTFGFPGNNFQDFSMGNYVTHSTQDPLSIQQISSTFFPDKSKDELATIIIRPFLIKQGFDELILNLLRINNLVVLERVYKKLSDYEVNLLADLESIHDGCFNSYHEIMTKGDVCVAILSGTCANEKIKFLIQGSEMFSSTLRLNGQSDGLVQVNLETLMDFFIQEADQIDLEQVNKLIEDSNIGFRSLKYLLNYEYAFLRDMIQTVVPNFITETGPADRIINRNIFRKPFNNFKEFSEASFHFNPNVYAPESAEHTFELGATFLPKVMQRTSIDILIHPFALKYSDAIIELLNCMSFTIVWSSLIRMNAEQFDNFVRLSSSYFVSFDRKEAERQWINKDFMILRISRTAAKYEFSKIIGKRLIT